MNWMAGPLAATVQGVTSLQLLNSALSGFGLGLGLIVAIGAQNAFVLRQGIRGEHVLAVVLLCIASDSVLILAGVAGAGALFTAVPWLVDAARLAGAVFLFGYAILAARRALRRLDSSAEGLVGATEVERVPVDTESGGEGPGSQTLTLASRPGSAVGTVAAPASQTRSAPETRRLGAVIGTALALTWLNPHVYLDTFVLLGSVGSTHGQARWAFAAGAILGSTLWFAALGLAARALAPVFARPIAWRVLDGLIAVVMATIAMGLLLGG